MGKVTQRTNWIAAMTVIVVVSIADAQTVSRVYEYRIADGSTRVVADNLHGAATPLWSPTGSSFSVFDNDPAKPEIRIYAASGALRKRVALPQMQGNGGAWSPDERWVVYRGPLGSADRKLIAVSTTSDSSRLLAPIEPLGHWSMVWSQDSRHVLMMRRPSDATIRTTTIERIDLEGKAETLSRSEDSSDPVNDSLLCEMRGRSFFIRPYADAVGEYRLITADHGYISGPAFSRDRNWVAFRRNPAADNNSALTLLEVMRLDGSARTQVTLPFSSAAFEDNPQFLPGAKQLIVAEDGRQTDSPGVYLVTMAAGTVKRLATISWERRHKSQFSVSPDGTRVLFWRTGGSER